MSQVHARFVAGTVGLVAFTVLGHESDSTFSSEWWYWVGVGTAVGAVFIEPYFTKPQDAIYNSLGGLVAWLTAARNEMAPLWTAFGIVWAFTLVAGVLAALWNGDGRFKRLMFRSSSLLGRTKNVGLTSLGVAAASVATTDVDSSAWLVAASLALLVGLSDPVVEILSSTLPTSKSASLIDAFGPGLVLVGGLPQGSRPGTRLNFKVDGKTYVLDLVQTLPGGDGARGTALVSDGWDALAAAFPRDGRLTLISGETHGAVGIVSAGTTPDTLRLAHSVPLEIGQPLVVPESGQDVDALFQVFAVSLAEHAWAGSRTLGPVAQLRQLGRNEDGFLRTIPNLPLPHAAVVRPAGEINATLPAGFLRLGLVKGTAFPIGISTDQAIRGHTAVLGMSGMGKTTTSNRVLSGLAGPGLALAVDATGEYRKSLGWNLWDGSPTSQGGFVHEIAGDLPVSTETLVTSLMTAGNAEFSTGTPMSRVVLLEEAHSLIPEWNFATRSQQDACAITCRAIMQARKFGLSFVIVSQRTAVVAKSALGQCETYIVFRAVDDTSLSYFEGIVGSAAREVLPNLGRYEALCFGPGFNSESPVVVQMDQP
jgi:hypothetical protein